MVRELRYLEPNKYVKVDDPSWDSIESCLEKLGQGIGVCNLTLTRGTLSIGHTSDPQRVTVTYLDDTSKHRGSVPDDFQDGWLLDGIYANSNATITQDVEGVIDIVLLYRTVPKEAAIKVAEYFWKTETFPDGLDWHSRRNRLR